MSANVRESLRGAVMRLDQADRLLVLLHYADGLGIGEISVVLDQPIENVSRRLDDLRWRLAQVMRDANVSASPADVLPIANEGLAASG